MNGTSQLTSSSFSKINQHKIMPINSTENPIEHSQNIFLVGINPHQFTHHIEINILIILVLKNINLIFENTELVQCHL